MSPGGGGVDVDIIVNPASALKVFKDLTRAADDMAKGVEGSVQRWESAVDHAAKFSTSVVNRTQQAQERYIKSIEQTAAAYGKSGVEKLISQRDAIIKRLGDEEKAVARVTAAYAKMIKVEQEKGKGGESGIFSGANSPLFRSMRDLAEGRTAYGLMAGGNALSAMSGLPMVLGGIAASFIAVEAAGYKSAKAIAEYGMQVHDMQIKTGMSAVQVQQLDFAAKMTGNDIGVMDRVMRGLTQALEGTDAKAQAARATLQGMGVDTMALKTGLMSPMEVLQKVSGALENQPNLWLRNKESIELFNRAGIQSLPMLVELNRSLRESQGIDFPGNKKIEEFHQIHAEILKAGTIWDMFLLKVKNELAQGFLFTLRFALANDPTNTAPQLEGGLPAWLAWMQPPRNLPNIPGMQYGKYPYGNVKNFLQPMQDALSSRYGAATGAGLGIVTATPAERYAHSLIGTDAEATSREAQRLRKNLDEMMSTGMMKTPGQSERIATVADIREATGAYQKMEASAKAIEKSESNRLSNLEALRKLTLDAAERAAHPYGMLAGERELESFLERPDITSGQAAEARARLTPVIHEEVLTNLRRAGLMEGPGGTIIRSDLQLKPEKLESASLTARGAEFTRQLREGEAADREALRPILAIITESRKNDEASALRSVKLSGMLAPSTIESRLGAESQIAEIKKRTALQEMMDNEQKIAKEYTTAENYENDLFALRLKYEGEVAAAREQYQEQYLQEVRHQMDEIKGKAESLFTTLFTHPSKFAAQLGTTLRDSAIHSIAGGMSEQAAQSLHPLVYGSNGMGGVAGMLRGLFGGGGRGGGGSGTSDYGWQFPGTGSMTPAGMIGGQGGPAWGAGDWGGSVWGGAAGMGNGVGLTSADLAIGGTAPFSGGMGGGSGAGAGGGSQRPGIGGGLGNLKGMWSNLKGMDWGGITRGDSTVTTDASGQTTASQGGITGTSGMLNTAIGMGGTALASYGLAGNARGTWAGVAEGTIGGAMLGWSIGSQFGVGPLGAAIGGGAGLLIGLGEKVAGVETPRNEAKRLVREQYHISINNTTADQIVQIAQSKYASHVSIAVRSPEVRQMLGLYAAGTGQAGAMPQSSSTPHGASLTESGGQLYQNKTWQYGNPYTYSSNLPVYGGGGGGSYPSPGGGGSTQIALSISGAGVAPFMTGQFVTPDFVNAQQTVAWNGSVNRMQNSLTLQEPGSSLG